MPQYGRVQPPISGKGGFRATSAVGSFGSGFSYKETRTYNQAGGSSSGMIQRASKAKRTYRENMEEETGEPSATKWAQTVLGQDCPKVPFNWCHLRGHGGGGSDTSDNICCSTTHANSEQMALEKVTYFVGNSWGQTSGRISVHVGYVEPIRDSKIGKTITYQVFLDDGVFYERLIDGYRTDKPDQNEFSSVTQQVIKALQLVMDSI